MNVLWVQTDMAVNTRASTHLDLTDVNATLDFYWEMTSAHARLV